MDDLGPLHGTPDFGTIAGPAIELNTFPEFDELPNNPVLSHEAMLGYRINIQLNSTSHLRRTLNQAWSPYIHTDWQLDVFSTDGVQTRTLKALWGVGKRQIASCL